MNYFATADEVHAAWVTYLFSGRKAAKLLTTTQLKEIVTSRLVFLLGAESTHTRVTWQRRYTCFYRGRNRDLSLVKLLAETMPLLVKQPLEARKERLCKSVVYLQELRGFYFLNFSPEGFA